MNYWLIIFAGIYLSALIYSAYKSKISIKSEKDYALPKVGVILGFLTFSATLFSTFTLMGMPDFFRTHGVGAWVFLGVTDTALAFVTLWFGLSLRRKYSKKNFTNVSNIIRDRYGNNLPVYIYRFGIFVFLIPYVAIQIKGIAAFIDFSNILAIPEWAWATLFLVIILSYSYVGGLKAIIVSDAIQGVTLLIVTTIIAYTCVINIGGFESFFAELATNKPQLLSIPGPKGLLTSQFLFSSFIVIILMPISQPQLLTRIVIMNSQKDTKRMAVAVSIFAFLIIMPTIFIGLYGALRYADSSTDAFLFNTLVTEQHAIIGALAIIGLIAAAMSTVDSQLFAIQAEVANYKKSKNNNKLLIIGFGLVALLLSIFTTKELVLLARVSFAGTALLAPMIFTAIFSNQKHSNILPYVTFASLILYVLSSFSAWIPSVILGIRLDMILLLVCTIVAMLQFMIYKSAPVYLEETIKSE
ncbi:SSS family solute:Na+ symporter [Balneicella halophila]|uniref:SSS family solute:Na+ symporter n=1 Tax=Balneicella halophila TaxID=1537566 RepID=A0A7L4URZ1_BALHA|nr:sodium:solute symporter family protein [Balneicella halophila]PVX52546.1 SSS family solute:Na+ symporter [Balneicella halophila]